MNKLFRRASIQTPPKLERELVCVERQPTGEWLAQISAIGGQSSFVMLIVTVPMQWVYANISLFRIPHAQLPKESPAMLDLWKGVLDSLGIRFPYLKGLLNSLTTSP